MFFDSLSMDQPEHWLVTWGFQGEAFETLKEYAEEMTFSARETIFSQGDDPNGMFLVVEGMVLILHNDKDGRERTLSIVTEGQSFGELGLLIKQPRLATAAAGLDVRLLKITPDTLETLEANQPGLVVPLYKALAETLAEQWMRTGPWVEDFRKKREK